MNKKIVHKKWLFGKTRAFTGGRHCAVTFVLIFRYTKQMMNLEALVKQAQGGDTQSFGLIYDAFADKIFRYITIKIQDSFEAEDILQEVFVKAWQGLPKFKADNGNFSAWLYRIATNCINDLFRKKYRRPDAVELDEAMHVAGQENIEHDLQDQMDRDVLHAHLEALPDKYREVLELRFVHDLTIEETAHALKKSNVTVRVLQFRALDKLRVRVLKNSTNT